MRANFRRVLSDDRQFKIVLWLLAGLMVAVLVGLNLYLLPQGEEFFYGGYKLANIEGTLYINMALADYAHDIFRPHWAALVRSLPPKLDESAKTEILARLTSLPGATNAYLLDRSDVLTAAHGNPVSSLRDSIMARRNIFKAYKFAGLKHPRKFHHLLFNQIRFENIPSDTDTLRLIFAAFDSSGDYFHVVPEKRFRPDMVKTLVAVQIDEKWVSNTLSSALDTLFYDRLIFALWSNANPKEDSIPEMGAGILAFGDTLWWEGRRSVPLGNTVEWEERESDFKNKAESLLNEWNWPVNDWFAFRTIASNNQETLDFPARQHRNFILVVVLADLGLLILAHLMILSLILLRRQWLSQQLALGHLAHAVRTPVARIRIGTDTLLKNLTTSPEDERDVINAIDAECQRLEGAVRRTSLSLEGIGNRANRLPCSMNTLIKRAAERWSGRFAGEKVILSISPLNTDCIVKADPELLEAMLDNLLDNALRHTSLQRRKQMSDKLEVRLELEVSARTATIKVDDQGGGIPDTDREHIFQRFYKPHSDAASGASGLGLGLALVKEIAVAHGGSVGVTPNGRNGSNFIVKLPIV